MKLLSKKTVIARLRELATYVERRQRAHPTCGYDQETFTHECGAPACMIGHGHALFGPRKAGELENALRAVEPINTMFSPWSVFGATAKTQLFSGRGCGDAGSDWRTAVKFVRDWCDAYEAQA